MSEFLQGPEQARSFPCESSRRERGVTLTELTVVFVLATLVMTGIVGFYLNSQSTWLSGATQAQTQREATLLLQTIADSTHASAKAVVSNFPDPAHQMLALYFPSDTIIARYCFWWSAGDQRVHGGQGPGFPDQGALVSSETTRFQLAQLSPSLVEVTGLDLRSASGDTIRVSSRFAIYNR